MRRKLFCEYNAFTYWLSTQLRCAMRRTQWGRMRGRWAGEIGESRLPVLAYEHQSLIRRQLGGVDAELQNNKARNLALAAKKFDGLLIRPGETLSFWRTHGRSTRAKGYLDGLVLRNGKLTRGTGGGMCQFTNLLHWMVLHSPLTVTEHHHHARFDLFADDDRHVPFGTGTSIQYNYIDYQLENRTDQTFQLVMEVTDTHLCGQLRCERPLGVRYDVVERNAYFARETDGVYRYNEVYRSTTDERTGERDEQLLLRNRALVMYDTALIPREKFKATQTPA